MIILLLHNKQLLLFDTKSVQHVTEPSDCYNAPHESQS